MKLNDLSHLSALLSEEESAAIRKENQAKQAKRKIGEEQDGSPMTVRVSLDKKARRGKAVTVIEGLRLSTEMRDTLARELRKKFSAGGTAIEDRIELQGDHVIKATRYLKEQGFNVTVR